MTRTFPTVQEVIAIHDALINDRPPAADGHWGRATLEVILSIFQSSQERRELLLSHQTPTADQALTSAMT